MWSYYGRKTKVVKYYPKPKYDTIIEPFAGTASYALYDNNWERDVILIDKYDVIIKVWKYLQQANSKDILSLPEVNNGEKIPNAHLLSPEERYLIGFCMNNASNSPRHTAGRMNFNSWKRDKIRIANDLYKIRHWKFILGEYNCIDNINATYFIDPPYQTGGEHYKKKFTDFDILSEWCMSRNGQVIVCEKSGANWLPFTFLRETYGQRKSQTEMMWYHSTIAN